jgi:hypothetical protein
MCAYDTTICRGLQLPYLPQMNACNQFLLVRHVQGKVYSNTCCTKDNLEKKMMMRKSKKKRRKKEKKRRRKEKKRKKKKKTALRM